MSGTVGPIETRPKTNVNTVTDLAFLDASPWISGELAFTIATQQTYELFREDTTSVIDNFNVVAVGPNSQGVGRWKRTCFLCSGPTGPTGATGPTGPAGATGPTSGIRILEGWFIQNGDEILGGVGANTPNTLLDRFSQPQNGIAPNNQYSATSFYPSKPGTIVELQLVTIPNPTTSGTLTGSVVINTFVAGVPVVLSIANPTQLAVAQSIPYVPGDVIDIVYNTVAYGEPLNGLIGMLRILE